MRTMIRTELDMVTEDLAKLFANPIVKVNLFVPDADIGPRTIYYVYLLDRGLDLSGGVSHPRVIVTCRHSNHY
jgi:hypothetical protein